MTLARPIKRIRPELDIYLLTDRQVEKMAGDPAASMIRRVFYEVEELMEVHLNILEGVADRFATPHFDNLKRYAARPIGTFHALPIARGKSIMKSNWIRDMGEFYGQNLFLAETSATTGGLDSMLEPTGNIKVAQEKFARAVGADHVFFVTNGTSTSNKMVYQAVTKPGDIVIADRNCHKSHHYGMVLSGAQPLYVEAFPMTEYSMYGAVPLRTVKQALLNLKAEGRLDRVKMVTLTNCTFDGHVYNTRRVMEECLAIKPDLIFLWDEAWFGFARWSPFLRPRTGLGAAAALEEWRQTPEALAAWQAQAAELGEDLDPKDAASARAAPGSRSAQDAHPRVRDRLGAQVDVVPAAGLDRGGAGRGLQPPRLGVPRGGVHPRLDLAERADHRIAGRRAAPDGTGGLRAGDARDRDLAGHPPRGRRAPDHLEVLQRAWRGRDDTGGVPPVGFQGFPHAGQQLGDGAQGDAGGRVLSRPHAHDAGVRHRRHGRHLVQEPAGVEVQHPAQQDLAQQRAAAEQHQQHAQRRCAADQGVARDLAGDRRRLAEGGESERAAFAAG